MSKIKEFKVAVTNDPICGNCDKPLSEHYHEHEIYCFTDTNGDVFDDEPSESYVMDKICEKYPNLYDEIVNQWQSDNGHK